MAVKLRLKRTGRRNRPYYRIAVMDARSTRGGKALEIIGHYEEWRCRSITPFERRTVLGYLASSTNEVNRQSINAAQAKTRQSLDEFMIDYLIEQTRMHTR